MKTKRKKTPAQLGKEFDAADKLWQLLKLALADLRACERMPRKFEIDMRVYVSRNGKCRVCLAGACLVGHGREAEFADGQKDVQQKARAINALRVGWVGVALSWLHDGRDAYRHHPLNRYMEPYGHPEWWAQMEKLLADLKAADI